MTTDSPGTSSAFRGRELSTVWLLFLACAQAPHETPGGAEVLSSPMSMPPQTSDVELDLGSSSPEIQPLPLCEQMCRKNCVVDSTMLARAVVADGEIRQHLPVLGIRLRIGRIRECLLGAAGDSGAQVELDLQLDRNGRPSIVNDVGVSGTEAACIADVLAGVSLWPSQSNTERRLGLYLERTVRPECRQTWIDPENPPPPDEIVTSPFACLRTARTGWLRASYQIQGCFGGSSQSLNVSWAFDSPPEGGSDLAMGPNVIEGRAALNEKTTRSLLERFVDITSHPTEAGCSSTTHYTVELAASCVGPNGEVLEPNESFSGDVCGLLPQWVTAVQLTRTIDTILKEYPARRTP